MDTIRIALFDRREHAEPVREGLVRAGFQAKIHEESRLVLAWFVSKSAAGIRLEVPAEQVAEATKFLLDWDAREGVLRYAVRCPECKSLRIDYPQFTQRSFLPNLTLGLASEISLIDKEYYCEDCHCMWTKPGRKPGRVRPHMAPNYFLE